MIELENVCVTYPDGTAALRNVDLRIADGESVALIGANGAGKSSLILALVGVLKSTGRIRVDGLLLGPDTLPEIRRRLGVVFQDPDDQLFMPTIGQDISFGPENYGVSPAETAARVSDVLSQLGIQALRDRSPLKLSGGEKRVCAIATVLVMDPAAMVFDEPTAFLDPRARRNLIRLLGRLTPTKLIATHDLAFADEVCPRAVLLREGEIFADGPCSELLYNDALMEECGVEAIQRRCPAHAR
jgi:cobalt/nickel transport system ATP-binding protein